MQRVFTRDVGKNFQKGKMADYPLNVWRNIATTAKMDLDAFSMPIMSPEHPQSLNPELLKKK